MPITYVRGNKILVQGQFQAGTIEIQNGKIQGIHPLTKDTGIAKCIDVGNKIVMPGLVDSHVHVNEPGRTEWEGFWTATRAAAAGGVTTIVDMPLNSIPPTTTVANFDVKLEAASRKCHVDVGFWGGVIPGNSSELKPLVESGVTGFKCFLIHSGVEEFPHVTENQVDEALTQLEGTGSVLAFHAEVDMHEPVTFENRDMYETYLNSRPPKMEHKAIEMISRQCKKHKDVRCHIVHLSAAEALPLISELKDGGYPLSVETCPHYLTLDADEVGDRRTEYKCCPPIREAKNQEKLWEGLRDGLIDMIVSDHSPCTDSLKRPGEIDFMECWGGIASVQFGLPIIWSSARKRGFKIKDISRWMSENPAKLASLGNVKGQIALGYDADLVIWDPDADIQVEDDMIHHKNKVTPYKGKVLKGKVHQTILRGEVIYDNGKFLPPRGHFIFPNCDEDLIGEIVAE